MDHNYVDEKSFDENLLGICPSKEDRIANKISQMTLGSSDNEPSTRVVHGDMVFNFRRQNFAIRPFYVNLTLLGQKKHHKSSRGQKGKKTQAFFGRTYFRLYSESGTYLYS